MPPAETFLDNLRRLHRDERSFLTAFVTGPVGPALGSEFLAEVQSKLGLEVPDTAFVAFDYQISSIYAAAVMTESKPGPHQIGGGIERGNQEQVDLLLAWESGDGVELILVEAEGVTGWSGKRLLSRALWLGEVFGYGSSEAFDWVRPHFAIASPSAPPADLPTLEWPEWMAGLDGPAWLKMPVPNDLLKVRKTTPIGKARATGGYWLVEHGSSA
jgi:hypothetical protein